MGMEIPSLFEVHGSNPGIKLSVCVRKNREIELM